MSSKAEVSPIDGDKLFPAKSEYSGNVESSPEAMRNVSTSVFLPEVSDIGSETSCDDLDTCSVNDKDLELVRLQRVYGLTDNFLEEARSILHVPVDLDQDLPLNAHEVLMKCVEAICEEEENRKVRDTLKKIFADDNIVAILENRTRNNLYPSVYFYIQDFINFIDLIQLKYRGQYDPLVHDSNGNMVVLGRWGTDENPVERRFQILNLRQDADENAKAAVMSEILKEINPTQMVWFHGTNEHSMSSILRDGILLVRGKRASNFGDKTFYMTDVLDKAINFASKKYPSDESIYIIVFAYTEDCLISDPLKKFASDGLDLTDPIQHERLRKIEAYFSNTHRAPEPRLDTEGITNRQIEQLQFILGPYCSFAGQGNRKKAANAQVDPSVRQLCLRKWDLKSCFEGCMSRVVIKVTGSQREEIYTPNISSGPRAIPVSPSLGETLDSPLGARSNPIEKIELQSQVGG